PIERDLARLVVQYGIGGPRIRVPRLADAARIDEPERARRDAQRGTDVSHDAVGADLHSARSVRMPRTADLELWIEAAQLEGHLVKALAAAHPADRVAEHRMQADDTGGGAQLPRQRRQIGELRRRERAPRPFDRPAGERPA